MLTCRMNTQLGCVNFFLGGGVKPSFTSFARDSKWGAVS